MKIIGNLNNGKKEVFLNQEVCIGDIVKVTDGGRQYSTYKTAYEYFWGNPEHYRIPYSGIWDERLCCYIPEYGKDTNVDLSQLENRWIVANMAVHHSSPHILLLHLRSRDFKNCVVGIEGVKVIRPIKLRPEEFEVEQVKEL